MSNEDREFQTEIANAFQAILAEIYPDHEGIPADPGYGGGEGWFEKHNEYTKAANAVSPYALATKITDLEEGDVIVYDEETSSTYRGQKDWSRVAGATAFQFVQRAGSYWNGAKLAVVVKKTAKSVEVSHLTRPGYSGTLESPEVLGRNQKAFTSRFGESGHRVVISLGQYTDVVRKIQESKHFPTLKAVCSDLLAEIKQDEIERDAEYAKALDARAPYAALADRGNAALGFDLFDVSERSDGLYLTVSDTRYGVATNINAHHEILRDVLAGRVALGKTEQDEVDFVLDLLERFIARNEDGSWSSIASRVTLEEVSA